MRQQNNTLPAQKVLLLVSPAPDQLQLPLTSMSSEQLEQPCQRDRTGTTETKIGASNGNCAYIKQFAC